MKAFLAAAVAATLFSVALMATPGNVGALTLTRDLAQGSSGPDVSDLQQFLKDRGFYTDPEITGYYGSATKDAVAAFQRTKGIPPLGGVGPATRASLNALSATTDSSTPTSSPTAPAGSTAAAAYSSLTRPLSEGMQGNDVQVLQQYLNDHKYFVGVIVTGFYGLAAKRAVAHFQRDNGLESVGSVGPKTLALLNGNASSASTPLTSEQGTSVVNLINSLLAQVKVLQAQLAALIAAKNGQTAPSSAFVLTRSLARGATGADVTTLQQFLQSAGYITVAPTGYFGPATAAAVAAFQKANNLEVVGNIGPKTLALINSLLASSGQTQSTGNGATPPTTSSTTSQTIVPNVTVNNYTSSVVSLPTMALSASPTSVSSGGSSTITWSSTNTTTCTASGSWTGTRATSGSQTFTNLTTNQIYTLQCTGVGGSAAQSVSVVVTSSSSETTPPSAPSNLSGSATSQTQVNLTWSASTDNVGVTGYQVFRNGVQVGAPAGTSYSDTGLVASTQYSYTVKAVDAAGNVSASSNSINITTQAIVDTTAPAVTITQPSSNLSAGTTQTTLSATTNEAALCRYSNNSAAAYGPPCQ